MLRQVGWVLRALSITTTTTNSIDSVVDLHIIAAIDHHVNYVLSTWRRVRRSFDRGQLLGAPRRRCARRQAGRRRRRRRRRVGTTTTSGAAPSGRRRARRGGLSIVFGAIRGRPGRTLHEQRAQRLGYVETLDVAVRNGCVANVERLCAQNTQRISIASCRKVGKLTKEHHSHAVAGTRSASPRCRTAHSSSATGIRVS